MIIKNADDYSPDISELNNLLKEKNLSSEQRKRIEEQLVNFEKGAWGEKRAAYFIDFHFASLRNTIVLHDLRLVLTDGRTAQIDHLVITRWLHVYVLESKNWSQLTVDETGACTTWAGRVIGVESPLQQCKRHIDILIATFRYHPRLAALASRQKVLPRVLLAPSCNLKTAPNHREWYLKADHFHSTWDKELENEGFLQDLVGLTRAVSRENLMEIGQILTSLHHSQSRDWRNHFGLPSSPVPTPLPKDVGPTPNPVVAQIEGLSEYVPRWGDDWFVLQGKPTEETKKILKSAGYRAKQENGEWVWRLK